MGEEVEITLWEEGRDKIIAEEMILTEFLIIIEFLISLFFGIIFRHNLLQWSRTHF